MSEEEKAIKRLEEMTKNYSLNSEDLHYSIILYYLIINLQKENKELKEEIKKINSIIDKQDRDIVTLSKGNKQLKERINKAIEYIENNPLYEEEYDYDYEENSYLSGVNDEIAKKDLLEILKGVE